MWYFILVMQANNMDDIWQKKSACNAGHSGLIPGLGRSPGEGNDNSLK